MSSYQLSGAGGAGEAGGAGGDEGDRRWGAMGTSIVGAGFTANV
ncbi:MAG: hypothetical protein ACLFWI_26455 [Coleofasciculus sp.]